MEETARQRFIRNHEDNANLIQTQIVLLEREGKFDDAAKVREMQATWNAIYERAVAEENGDTPDA